MQCLCRAQPLELDAELDFLAQVTLERFKRPWIVPQSGTASLSYRFMASSILSMFLVLPPRAEEGAARAVFKRNNACQ